jgi:hypothetical protein
LTTSLAGHLGYLRAELEAARAAPLSAKRARLAALLIDAYVDRLFAARHAGDADVLAFRAELAVGSPALAAAFELANGTARLVTEAVEVPLDDYPALPLADFMVSLYNDHTVQRVFIVTPEGQRLPVHDVLGQALATIEKETDVPL